MVGSLGTLGVLAEATVRLHPIPPAWGARLWTFESVAGAAAHVAAILDSTLQPERLVLLGAGRAPRRARRGAGRSGRAAAGRRRGGGVGGEHRRGGAGSGGAPRATGCGARRSRLRAHGRLLEPARRRARQPGGAQARRRAGAPRPLAQAARARRARWRRRAHRRRRGRQRRAPRGASRAGRRRPALEHLARGSGGRAARGAGARRRQPRRGARAAGGEGDAGRLGARGARRCSTSCAASSTSSIPPGSSIPAGSRVACEERVRRHRSAVDGRAAGLRALRDLPSAVPHLPRPGRGDGLAARPSLPDARRRRGTHRSSRRRSRIIWTSVSAAAPARPPAPPACPSASSSRPRAASSSARACGARRRSRYRSAPARAVHAARPAARPCCARCGSTRERGSRRRCAASTSCRPSSGSGRWRRCCRRFPRAERAPLPEVTPARGRGDGRVGLLTGCVQSVFFPHVNAETARLLSAAGWDVVTPRGSRGAAAPCTCTPDG